MNFVFTPFPKLSTERLNLRQLNKNDKDEIFTLRTDEKVGKYLHKPVCKSNEDALKFINNINNGISKNESLYWAITLKEDNKLIGTICIWNIIKQHFRAEIGFELLPDFQGKGYMQEALTEVLNYSFNVMNLHSIAGNVDPNNSPSIKIMERNGFIKRSVLQRRLSCGWKIFRYSCIFAG